MAEFLAGGALGGQRRVTAISGSFGVLRNFR
jgi:hypothetical protein